MGTGSSPTLQLVRSICSTWERGDYSGVEWAHPDIEFVVADGPEPHSVKGRHVLAPDLLGFQDAWERYHSEPVEYRELDEERVLVLTRAAGRGMASGAELKQDRANLFEVSGGAVVRLVAYWDRRRALDDVAATAS